MLEVPSLANLTKQNFGRSPKNQNVLLMNLGRPHVSSFNQMTTTGLDLAVSDLTPIEFILDGDKVCLKISAAELSPPMVPTGTVGIRDVRIFPTECRQRAATYKGKLIVTLDWWLNGVQQQTVQKDLGNLPIMIKSNRCHLNNLNPKQLVDRNEHEQEWGGYFVIKGHERLIRMLLLTRRNFPIAIKRSTWKDKGALFSEFGVSVRCTKEDETSTTNVVHFVNDGTVKLMFSYNKTPFYVPLMLILKCLCDYVDYYVYQKLTQGYEDDAYYKESVKNMLLDLAMKGFKTHQQCKEYLGKIFRIKFYELPPWYTDLEVADYILAKCIMIHLNRPEDKFNLLTLMVQKLFVFVQDKCKVEGVDCVMMQELLLGGHLYQQILKEKMQNWLMFLKTTMLKRSTSIAGFVLDQTEFMQCARRTGTLETAMENFFATGNLSSQSGLGLSQNSGLTIVAENINRMRYMSHFKAVHRGSFFQEMRTTEVRQLLPDAWGFICPVHTPDGSPCGLLNHLTMDCQVTEQPDVAKVSRIPVVLSELGMHSISSTVNIDYKNCYTVILDGKVLGFIADSDIESLVFKLRLYKIKGERIPRTLEIVWVKKRKIVAQFPGLFLFSGPARMMRPVMNLIHKDIELIGTFEQVYLDICVTPKEFYPQLTTHMELSKLGFLSNLAQLIPMPDCNQSPRNMYQCQMGKQTMGSPCHNWKQQSETKLYRLQTPQSPLFRPVHHDNINLDDFAMGTNAIVAVISYTGYDMEDAMVINKAADERGMAHGCIYKSEFLELDHIESYFCRNPETPELSKYLESDGLPFIGRKMTNDEPLFCYFSVDKSQYVVRNFKGKEECYVDNVKLCGKFENNAKIACITYRIPRNPCVGDKFASRAGQKGICSHKWQMEDLPFTESGLVPDIIFNPHGFPSRMTIAMMIEVMAGKSAAWHGLVHDATPFKFNENDTAIDYFGRCLKIGGYNYHGTETMYSGIDGREMSAHIFMGVVHYQRLRHMVSDKWQVRSTGPNDIITRQPIKGRKRGGGVRFGEMERDALISHGASFLLQDRLLHCSDKTTTLICTSCGTLVGPMTMATSPMDRPQYTDFEKTCRLCGHDKNVATIEIPYIFKFFVIQLASVNIKVRLQCERV